MWFRLAPSTYHYEPKTLAALVGDDGKCYWRISDIGRLLGKPNPSQYANQCKIKKVRGRRVVRGRLMKPTAKALLCTTLDAMQLLHQEDTEKARWFTKALTEGMCCVHGDRLVATYTKCPILCMGRKSISILEWILQFKRRVLESRSLDVTVLKEFERIVKRKMYQSTKVKYVK